MMKIRHILNLFADRLTATFHHEASINVFCKALYFFLVFKIVYYWGTPALILEYIPVRETSSWMSSLILLPARLASTSYLLFALIFLVILTVAIVIRRNYLLAIAIAWFGWNFYIITFPASNGGDYILIMLSFLAIPMCSYPRANDEIIFFMQKVGHNGGLVMCQLQVALIYLISGLDKIESELWRTGDSIQYIDKLSFLVNPNLSHWLLPGDLMPFILSWLVIIFELSFPILVWFREFRPFVLVAGVIFHLCIAIFLSLPDFGLIMIIAYIPFLTDMIVIPKKNKRIIKKIVDTSWIRS